MAGAPSGLLPVAFVYLPFVEYYVSGLDRLGEGIACASVQPTPHPQEDRDEKTLIANARVWDGSGGAGLCRRNPDRRQPHRSRGARRRRLPPEGVHRIDVRDMTVMPGLVEGHAHLSFCGVVRHTELGELPPEDHAFETMHNARTLLEAGFTSASARRARSLPLDVAVRNQIAAGVSPARGCVPRARRSPSPAASSDNDRLHLAQSSFGLVVDGPLAMARGAVVRSRGRRHDQDQPVGRLRPSPRPKNAR